MSPQSPRAARPLIVVLVVLALGLIAAACGTDVDALSIGDQSLTRGELDAILDSEFPDTADGNHAAGSAAEFLSQFIYGEAVAAELAVRDFPITEEAVGESAERLAAVAPDFDPESTEGHFAARFEAIAATFEEWIDANIPSVDVGVPEYLCAGHILVETEMEALEIGVRLADGADFEELAVELSTGPSGPDGGDLGCAPSAGYVPEFTDGARLVAPSGVTGPVQSQFGWHVINVRSIGPLSADNHPEMDPLVVEQELDGVRAAAQEGFVAPLVDEIQTAALARIDRELVLDPRYGSWDPLVGVDPPDGVTEGTDPVTDGTDPVTDGVSEG